MPSQPRLCIAGLVTLVLIILLVGLVNNPYYSPPLPKSLSWAAGSLLSQSSLDTYDEAPDRTHAAFQDVDNEHEDFREFKTPDIEGFACCLALDNCGRNRTKVVLFTGYWVMDGIVRRPSFSLRMGEGLL